MSNLEGLISHAQTPKLFFVDSQGQAFANVIAAICGAKERKVIRLTGGCGDMSDHDAEGFLSLFTESFEGFQGAVLFGGTRMMTRGGTEQVKLGITELGPAIRRQNPEALVIGVVAKTAEMQLTSEGLIVSDAANKEFITIVHPDQDVTLAVDIEGCGAELNAQRRRRYAEVVRELAKYELLAKRYPADPASLSPWDGEFLQCEAIIRTLIQFSRWQSLLTVYNGGGTTLKEVIAHLLNGWPVLVVNGSGRVADDIVKDTQLRGAFGKNLRVVEPDVASMRDALEQLGVVTPRAIPGDTVIRFRSA